MKYKNKKSVTGSKTTFFVAVIATFFVACSSDKQVKSETELVDVKINSGSTPEENEEIQNYIQSIANGTKELSYTLIRVDEIANKRPIRTYNPGWKAWCKSKWNKSCKGTETYTPPEGYDICSYTAVEQSLRGNATWSISATRKKISVQLNSAGSGNVFDQKGANVQVGITMVSLIRTSATEEEWKKASCSLQNSTGQGLYRAETFACLPNPLADPGSRLGIQTCRNCRQVDGKKECKGPYVCGTCLL